jgi:hypothetical protein
MDPEELLEYMVREDIVEFARENLEDSFSFDKVKETVDTFWRIEYDIEV